MVVPFAYLWSASALFFVLSTWTRGFAFQQMPDHPRFGFVPGRVGQRRRHGHLPSPGPSSPSITLSLSANPNDMETPEEREARMELVRKIQASFYQDDADTTTATGSSATVVDGENEEGDGSRKTNSASKWLQKDPARPSILRGLPLWRVQWTELPGYQNVLNVHVPHYTHMFRKLVLQHPPPWFFGHLYLPEGSKNLGNPEYFLPEDEENFEEPGEPEVVRTGTLMQITDYTTEEDGRLRLIVQGVGRFQVLEASQQVPYAVASKVKILPDQEAWEQYLLPLVGNTPMAFDLSMALIEATQDVAVSEGDLWRELEYYTTKLDDVGKDAMAASKDGFPIQISPLSNVNASAPTLHWRELQKQLDSVFSQSLTDQAQSKGSDEILLATSTMKLLHASNIIKDSKDDTSEKKVRSPMILDEEIRSWESKVWIELDRLIQLLQRAQPGLKIPVPAQILGLIPTEGVEWPEGFRLEGYAEQLGQREDAKIGTYTKSPFCRISQRFPEYPALRRASRLSYVIWMMLSSIAIEGRSAASPERIMELSSIRGRLKLAHDQLRTVNKALSSM